MHFVNNCCLGLDDRLLLSYMDNKHKLRISTLSENVIIIHSNSGIVPIKVDDNIFCSGPSTTSVVLAKVSNARVRTDLQMTGMLRSTGVMMR